MSTGIDPEELQLLDDALLALADEVLQTLLPSDQTLIRKLGVEFKSIVWPDHWRPGNPAYTSNDHSIGLLVLRLAPLSDACRRFVIAHELAHVILRHPELGRMANENEEEQANCLAQAWGYPLPAEY